MPKLKCVCKGIKIKRLYVRSDLASDGGTRRFLNRVVTFQQKTPSVFWKGFGVNAQVDLEFVDDIGRDQERIGLVGGSVRIGAKGIAMFNVIPVDCSQLTT